MNLPTHETGWRTIYADPPWNYMRGGIAGPEGGAKGSGRTGDVRMGTSKAHYETLKLSDIATMPVADHVAEDSHLYLWAPNALLPGALEVMKAWGFTYKANVVWVKKRRDGGIYGGGLGNYFRNATELCLFGIRGRRNPGPARHGRHNVLEERWPRQHSVKPQSMYELIEAVSPGPYLELFARGPREGWTVWGDQL